MHDPDAAARALVERFFEASEAGDREVLAALVDDDMIMDWPQSGERFRGRDDVLAAMAAVLIARPGETTSTNLDMTTAAQQFLASLSEQQRTQATFAYDDAERLNWHFIPRVRKGVPLRDLDGDSAQAAQRLIASGLSKDGYDQALNVMACGGVFLCGGVIARIGPSIKKDVFSAAFCAKGAHASILMRIPVRAIVNERIALLGAARVASS